MVLEISHLNLCGRHVYEVVEEAEQTAAIDAQ